MSVSKFTDGGKGVSRAAFNAMIDEINQTATPTDSGLMSASDKVKMDGLDTKLSLKANKTEVDTALSGKASTTHDHKNTYNENILFVPKVVFDDFNYAVGYSGSIQGFDTAPNVDWWHVIYIPHSIRNGYGAQILTSFHGTGWMYMRSATGTGWGAWTIVYTGENITITQGSAPAYSGEGCIHFVY